MFFHISPHFTDDTTALFHLKVPSCRADGEDDTMLRVCVAPTLEGCWMGKEGYSFVRHFCEFDINWYADVVLGQTYRWEDDVRERMDGAVSKMMDVWV